MGDILGVGGAPRRALMWPALKTAVLLSLLFMLVYGGTNWLTAQRPEAHVNTWYFAWEPEILPFVPALLVPYMSIDLFFFLAPFVCLSEREMRVLARRVVFSILTAAALFLLLPLKLAWPELPAVDGWFGYFVRKSVTAPFLMEYPHNLFPALHITLCAILTDFYARHTRGTLRVLVYVWSALIVVSTVLTWQHHLVDVAGGFVVAGFAFHLFRESSPRLPVVANVRIGACYALAAVAVLALAPVIWPWGVFLLWPAAALGIVAAAYFGLGPGIFRKTDGRLPLSTRFVMAPILAGQYLSLWHYRRRCRAWDEVVPGVLVGCTLTESEAKAAVQQGVTAVLDLTAEFSEAASFRGTTYRNLPILDLTTPTQQQLCEAVVFLTHEAAKGTVYLHCKIGYSRSAAVAGAYLLASGEVDTAEEAIARLREARPSIIIRPEALEALRSFARAPRRGELQVVSKARAG
jgi:protein-tyrosine phosphatase/membrane-associated phospholipid phosphatase